MASSQQVPTPCAARRRATRRIPAVFPFLAFAVLLAAPGTAILRAVPPPDAVLFTRDGQPCTYQAFLDLGRHGRRDCSWALFRGALAGVSFHDTDLFEADFTGADCAGAHLDGQNLTRTRLLLPVYARQQPFAGTTFAGATLRQGDYRRLEELGANLEGAFWIKEEPDAGPVPYRGGGSLAMDQEVDAAPPPSDKNEKEPSAAPAGSALDLLALAAGAPAPPVTAGAGSSDPGAGSGTPATSSGSVLSRRMAGLPPFLGWTREGQILRERKDLDFVTDLGFVTFLAGADLSGVDFTLAGSLQGATLAGVYCPGARFDCMELGGTDLQDIVCPGASFRNARLHESFREPLEAQGCDLTGATFSAGARHPHFTLPSANQRTPASWCRKFKIYSDLWRVQGRRPNSRDPQESSVLHWWQRETRKKTWKPWQWDSWAAFPDLSPFADRGGEGVAPATEPSGGPKGNLQQPPIPAGPAAPRPTVSAAAVAPAIPEAATGPAAPAAASSPALPAAASVRTAKPAPGLPFQDLGKGLAAACRRRQPNPWQAWGRTLIANPLGPRSLPLPAKAPDELGRLMTWREGGRTIRREASAGKLFTMLPTYPRVDSVLEILTKGDQGPVSSLRFSTGRVRGAFALPLPFQPASLGGLAVQIREDGSLWCALVDTGARNVRVFCLDGEPRGALVWGVPGKDAGLATFHTPTAVAWGKLGGMGKGTYQIFVADRGDHTVRRLLPGGRASTWGQPGQPGSDDGLAREARFHDPVGLAICEEGVFVADRGNGRIRIIQASDGRVVTLGCSSEAPGSGGEHRFQDLRAIAWALFEGQCNLLVVDGRRLCRITGAGSLTTLREFENQLCALATGPSGDRVFLANEKGVLGVYDTASRVLTSVAGIPDDDPGRPPVAGPRAFKPGLLADDSPPVAQCARLGGMRHLAVDPEGALFLTLPGTLVTIPVPDRPAVGPTRVELAQAEVRVGEPLDVACTVPDQAWPEYRPETRTWAEGVRERRAVTVSIMAFHADDTQAGGTWRQDGLQGQRFAAQFRLRKPGVGRVWVDWITDQGVRGGVLQEILVRPLEAGPAAQATGEVAAMGKVAATGEVAATGKVAATGEVAAVGEATEAVVRRGVKRPADGAADAQERADKQARPEVALRPAGALDPGEPAG